MILHPEHLGKIAQVRDQPDAAYHRASQGPPVESVKRGTQGIRYTWGINDSTISRAASKISSPCNVILSGRACFAGSSPIGNRDVQVDQPGRDGDGHILADRQHDILPC